jgi:hypothetical protein
VVWQGRSLRAAPYADRLPMQEGEEAEREAGGSRQTLDPEP